MLIGCSSFSNIYLSQTSGLPLWVFDSKVRNTSSEIAIVGKGEAENEREAILKAYVNILEQVSSYLGEDVNHLYYRELSTLGSVQELGLKEKETAVKHESNTTVWVLCTMENSIFESLRSNIYKDFLQEKTKIDALVSSATLAIQQNRDIAAIDLFLDAYGIALEQPPQYLEKEPSYYLDKAVNALELISLEVLETNPEAVTCELSVKRKSGFIPTRIDDCPIQALFKAIAPDGGYYDDTFIFNTNKKGKVNFQTTNLEMVDNGEIKFSIKLRNAGKYPEIDSLIETLQTNFKYNRIYDKNLLVGISVLQYDIKGNVNQEGYFSNILKNFFIDGGINSNILNELLLQDNLDYLSKDEIFKLSENSSYVVTGKVGVTTRREMYDGSIIYVVGGQVFLYDAKTQKTKFESDTFYISSMDEDDSKALYKALELFARACYLQIRGNLW